MPIFRKKNAGFFKLWTPDMAYILGFFAADGNLTQGARGNRYVEFTSCDENIILLIRATLGSNHKVGVHASNGRDRPSYRLQIGSREMFEDLVNLGFMPRKSLILKLPSIPNSYFSHFVRGYFDGDGHVWVGKGHSARMRTEITLSTGFTSGSSNFIRGFQTAILNHCGIRGVLRKAPDAYQLKYSVRASLLLQEFMYNNATLYLARKRRKFEEYAKLRL